MELIKRPKSHCLIDSFVKIPFHYGVAARINSTEGEPSFFTCSRLYFILSRLCSNLLVNELLSSFYVVRKALVALLLLGQHFHNGLSCRVLSLSFLVFTTLHFYN